YFRQRMILMQTYEGSTFGSAKGRGLVINSKTTKKKNDEVPGSLSRLFSHSKYDTFFINRFITVG
ncbi:MAG: hypothetical protein LUG18_10840, partial [Candidatus Azobacteroides sp.]|nr:hypothetical protein [Candidatus Azobacteroides sp.]